MNPYITRKQHIDASMLGLAAALKAGDSFTAAQLEAIVEDATGSVTTGKGFYSGDPNACPLTRAGVHDDSEPMWSFIEVRDKAMENAVRANGHGDRWIGFKTVEVRDDE